ncbi:hypothetical protein [Streptomyces sp. NPDC127038]|uniref:hypothetical protein n=1 Tax=Streptomyces sp. NPDC127038 TaxID=3347114 RepID=UPI003661A3E7
MSPVPEPPVRLEMHAREPFAQAHRFYGVGEYEALTATAHYAVYTKRDENGFPEIADMRGRARLWDHAEVTAWFAQRPLARLRDHTPPSRDPQDLLTGAEASRFLGYGYFPDPDVVEELGTEEHPYLRRKWRVQTLLDWMATRPGSGQHLGTQRGAPALPEVSVDGDPDELLGASEAAALLQFKSVNSFSSSLSQGNLPLLETPDALSERGGRRRWTRKRILEQAAKRNPKGRNKPS